MRNPVRRNRKIGTRAAGHGQDNKMGIPEPRQRGQAWHLAHENLGQVTVAHHALAGQEIALIIEETRPGFSFGNSPDAVLEPLTRLAEAGFVLPDLLVF